MTRDELFDEILRAICCPSGCGSPKACASSCDDERIHQASAALSVITKWLESEASRADELLNNPHRLQDFTTTISLSASAREIRRLIAVTKGGMMMENETETKPLCITWEPGSENNGMPAYARGMRAQLSGYKRHDNPYPYGSVAQRAWDLGYDR